MDGVAFILPENDTDLIAKVRQVINSHMAGPRPGPGCNANGRDQARALAREEWEKMFPRGTTNFTHGQDFGGVSAPLPTGTTNSAQPTNGHAAKSETKAPDEEGFEENDDGGTSDIDPVEHYADQFAKALADMIDADEVLHAATGSYLVCYDAKFGNDVWLEAGDVGPSAADALNEALHDFCCRFQRHLAMRARRTTAKTAA